MIRKTKAIISTEDVQSIISIFLKNWYFYILFPAVTWVVAYIYKSKITEVYEAKTQILLKSYETYRYQEPLYRSLGYYEAYQDIINQMRVIRSANLLAATIKKLNLEVSYYIIGRLKTIEVYRYLPFRITPQIYTPAFYENEFYLRIIDTLNYEVTYERREGTVKRTGTFGDPLVSGDFNILVEKNPGFINIGNLENLKRINYMFKCHSLNYLIGFYQSNLSVDNAEWTAIMDITMRDVIPERAITFLDTLSTEYINYTMQSQIQINENTLVYIDRQMDEVVEILNDLEKQLDMYKDEKAILDLSREENQYFTKLVESESYEKQLQLQMQTIDALEKYVTSNDEDRLLPPSLYVLENDEYLKKTLNELYNLHIAANGILFDVTMESLTIEEIKKKIQLLKDDLLSYLENTRKAIKVKMVAVKEQTGYYESILRGIPRTQRQMINFKRKLDVNEKMYSYLLERRANTIIARAGIIPETKVIESPYVTGIVEPDEDRIFYSFLGIGIALALIATFIRTLFFERIESIEELKNITRLPILGDVPYIKKKAADQYLIIDSNPRTLISESYRLIRTNLEFFASGQKSKIILVTSNNPNEGKTFCVINLAAILAKAGKRTIILEMDLHKPKMSAIFKLPAEKGMTRYLTELESYESLILPSGIGNLELIHAGTIPPNPSELVLSPLIPALIAGLKEKYDYIIVDTPPVGLITDSLVLMRLSDINLFVINAKKPNKNDIMSTHLMLDENKFSNTGFILNNVKAAKSKYYYKYYRYNYNYQYGYGSKNQGSDNGKRPSEVQGVISGTSPGS